MTNIGIDQCSDAKLKIKLSSPKCNRKLVYIIYRLLVHLLYIPVTVKGGGVSYAPTHGFSSNLTW